jgi:hypothetical protein
MLNPNSAIDAEAYRRRHCDSPERKHQCLGIITLKPGMVQFDCKLCGAETLMTSPAIDALDDGHDTEVCPVHGSTLIFLSETFRQYGCSCTFQHGVLTNHVR